MSEIQTSLDFRQFSFDQLQTVQISNTIFCLNSELLKIQRGQKVLISDRKECLKSKCLCSDFGHFLSTYFRLYLFSETKCESVKTKP